MWINWLKWGLLRIGTLLLIRWVCFQINDTYMKMGIVRERQHFNSCCLSQYSLQTFNSRAMSWCGSIVFIYIVSYKIFYFLKSPEIQLEFKGPILRWIFLNFCLLTGGLVNVIKSLFGSMKNSSLVSAQPFRAKFPASFEAVNVLNHEMCDTAQKKKKDLKMGIIWDV